LAAPQYKGGGIVFGPKPKFDMHVRINKKEKRAAIRALLAEKLKENKVHVLTGVDFEMPKTKIMASFFDELEMVDRRILVLMGSSRGSPHENMVKSLKNLPKKSSSLVPQINGHSVILAQDVIVLESALDEFLDKNPIDAREIIGKILLAAKARKAAKKSAFTVGSHLGSKTH